MTHEECWAEGVETVSVEVPKGQAHRLETIIRKGAIGGLTIIPTQDPLFKVVHQDEDGSPLNEWLMHESHLFYAGFPMRIGTPRP